VQESLRAGSSGIHGTGLRFPIGLEGHFITLYRAKHDSGGWRERLGRKLHRFAFAEDVIDRSGNLLHPRRPLFSMRWPESKGKGSGRPGLDANLNRLPSDSQLDRGGGQNFGLAGVGHLYGGAAAAPHNAGCRPPHDLGHPPWQEWGRKIYRRRKVLRDIGSGTGSLTTNR